MVVLAVSMALKPVELTHFLRTLNPKIIQTPHPTSLHLGSPKALCWEDMVSYSSLCICPMPDTVLSISHTWIYLILEATQWGKSYCFECPHFRHGETKVQKVNSPNGWLVVEVGLDPSSSWA